MMTEEFGSSHVFNERPGGIFSKQCWGIDFTLVIINSHSLDDEDITSNNELGSTINAKSTELTVPEIDYAQIMSNLYISAGLK